MKTNNDWQANTIKVAAVATAMPRWIGALLMADGLSVPVSWLPWWTVFSSKRS